MLHKSVNSFKHKELIRFPFSLQSIVYNKILYSSALLRKMWRNAKFYWVIKLFSKNADLYRNTVFIQFYLVTIYYLPLPKDFCKLSRAVLPLKLT